MFKGFQAFLMRGNVVDLAVAVVIGTAFTAVVTSFVAAFITPLIALIFGKPNIFGLSFSVNGVTFPVYGFLNALITFIAVAAVVYYGIVMPINRLIAWQHSKDAPADPTTKKCPECLSEIPIGAKRCSHCAQPQPA